jgi:hypothetical protein
MLIVQTIVSRKTPGDGRLEIPESLAARLQSLEMPLTIEAGDDEHGVTLEEMACTCSKASGGQHSHHFLVSEVLKGLTPETNVSVVVDVVGGSIQIDTES